MTKCVNCVTNNKLHPFDKCIECIKYVLEKPQVLISNVLAYVNSYRSGHSRLKVLLACLKGFSIDDIADAKELLFKEYEYILGTPTRRQGGSKKNISEYNIEDIYDAFTALDKKEIVVKCVADKIKLLPKFNPEELELTSILERLLKLEVKIEDHENRLDQGLATEIKQAGEIEDTKKQVQNVDKEVKNCMSIVDDTRNEIQTQESKVTSLKTVIQQDKLSYANIIKNGGSEWQTMNSSSNGSQYKNNSGNRGNTINGFNNYRRPQVKSYYGASKTGTTNSKDMGAPLPSRFIVIERVRRHISKDDISGHISFKNKHIEVRSVKLMSKNDSQYKRYLLEVPVNQLDTVINENFWTEGVRVRIFKGNGKLWNDRDDERAAEVEDDSPDGENGEASS